MSEHSVQVVISGQGGQQIHLRVQGATSGRPVVLQVASVSSPAPPAAPETGPLLRPFGAPSTIPPAPCPGPAISLELRLRDPAPVVTPEPARERVNTTGA